jgi:hypothetical protein
MFNEINIQKVTTEFSINNRNVKVIRHNNNLKDFKFFSGSEGLYCALLAIIPCNLVGGYQCNGGTYCLYLNGGLLLT